MISQLKRSFLPFRLMNESILKSIKYQLAQPKKFRVLTQPKDVSKLVFQADGRCKIFQHKNGEGQLKFITRALALITCFNSVLLGIQLAYPIFGAWNQFSFSLVGGMGYFALLMLQNLSRRTIHKMYLYKDLQTVDVLFYNAFWKPQTINFHISEFENPCPSYVGFIRIDLTSLGKTWIKLQKNEFRNVKDYEQTLDSILLGKPLTSINLAKKDKK